MTGFGWGALLIAAGLLPQAGRHGAAAEADGARVARRRVQGAHDLRRGTAAKAHAARVDSLLGELTNADKQALTRLLDGAKSSIRRKLTKGVAP